MAGKQPAVQPIPVNNPNTNSADTQAVKLLALHNRSTDGRVRTPARWNPTTRRGSVAGENSGTRRK